ncbi:MAG: rhodanese-like domain-containing protein [Flavobacteriales bacterium]|nr:rhodanese-like domain-containing protein [Flavobacteriales bacterium]
MKKIALLLMLLPSIMSVSAQTNTTEQEETRIFHVNVEQFAKLVDNDKGLILDVRTPGEWADGTIGNATRINYYDRDFADQVDKLDRETPILVYCKAGGRSMSAAEILQEKGFKKVFNLDGGITAWIKAGKNLTK